MDSWDEVRTAYHVAREGTVSGAAAALGVHHATVIRHIDALEARLGTKLFQRHARGYTPTEAGTDLFQVAACTNDQLAQLEGRLRGRGSEVSGELVVTTLAGFSATLAPVLTRFRAENPDLIVRLLTGDRLYRLEYGEAHVAIRAGDAPQEPDNVVQPFIRQRFALYATGDYAARHGRLRGTDDMANHLFVSHDNRDSRAPFYRWLNDRAPADRVIFRANDMRSLAEAVFAGAGVGFVPVQEARLRNLVEMMPPREEWEAPTWLVTHVDLHRTAKVQAFLTFLKAEAATWEI